MAAQRCDSGCSVSTAAGRSRAAGACRPARPPVQPAFRRASNTAALRAAAIRASPRPAAIAAAAAATAGAGARSRAGSKRAHRCAAQQRPGSGGEEASPWSDTARGNSSGGSGGGGIGGATFQQQQQQQMLDPNMWAHKPAWCQPWSIVLTGAAVVGGAWRASFGSAGWTALAALLIAAWWGLFLVLAPAQFREYAEAANREAAARRESAAGGGGGSGGAA